MPSHWSAVGRSLRKAVARATVHRGYRAVSGMATLAFAPFSRHANTAQFPSPLTAPAISPTRIIAALRPDSVVVIHMKGSKTTKPAVTQITMERADIRLVPSFMNKPLTPHSTMAKLAYTIQWITSSSNRKDYDRRQGQKHAPHLHLVQPLPQNYERQHHREHGKDSGEWSDYGSILFSQGSKVPESTQSGGNAAQEAIRDAATVAIHLPSHLQQHPKGDRQHAQGEQDLHL